MNKIKIVIVCLVIPFFIVVILTFIKIKSKEEFRQKAILAQEVRKVSERLMFDLLEAHENTILNIPADGLWRNRIVFGRTRQEVLEYIIKDGYLLRVNNGKTVVVADDIDKLEIRRQKETPDILEVQIEARKNVSLISSLRIRIRH